MKIFFENVNLHSTSGPNSFAAKLITELIKDDCEIAPNHGSADVRLCFIESHHHKMYSQAPLIQRLDGIYFNKSQNYLEQNRNIKRTYKMSDGVVFQSNFNKELIFRYFGPHDNYQIIHNGADTNTISSVPALMNNFFSKYNNVWTCASSWRPHKRLNENVRYFLEHADAEDCLVVAGIPDQDLPDDPRIIRVGFASPRQLLSLYKISKYFIHLAWLDHCPNVVVDARAAGCKIICSSTGGTKEIAGLDAIVIEEDEWNFEPVELYNPPSMDFNKKINNQYDSVYNMSVVGEKYKNFMSSVINESLCR